MRPITARQQAILDFVRGYLRDRGFPPTLREIGTALGLSNVSAVRGHLAALEKKGFISKDPDKARSIRIVGGPSILSRFKRKLHECARTDEGVFHQVVYGLALATKGRWACLAGPLEACVEQVVQRQATEHGWTVVRKQIQPDHIVLVVRVWPNHSPGQVVGRIRHACEAFLRRKAPGLLAGRRLWAKGCVITTDPSQLDEMVGAFLEDVAARG
jgi:REP element-mobilizing transposase RayT